MSGPSKRTSFGNSYKMLFIFFFFTYAYFFQGGGWTQNTRIYLTQAILHQGTFVIDAYKEDSKNHDFEFVNTGDWAYRDGHYYTNKSPALSIMAIPAFAVTEGVMRALVPGDAEKQVFVSAYMSTLTTVVLCGTLLCLLVFHVVCRFFHCSRVQGIWLALLFGTGTLWFSYSTSFYCHCVSAFFCFLALVLLMHVKHDEHAKHHGLLTLLAGASASFAVLVEASMLFAIPCLVLYLASFAKGRRCLWCFFAGCIPAGGFQLFYNAVCFGGPFESSYAHANPAVMCYENGCLFSPPTLKRILELSVLPYRGLFVTSPVLIMALPGIVLFWKKRLLRAECAVFAGISLVFFIFIASFNAWYGGSAPGPRYILPAYPFIFVLTVFACRRYPRIYTVVGLLSVCINLAITTVGNDIPGSVRFPLRDVVLKNILAGHVSINPVPFSNFENYPDIYTLANVDKWQPNFNSFNWGEWLFPHSLTSLVPLLCFWLLWLWLAFCRRS